MRVRAGVAVLGLLVSGMTAIGVAAPAAAATLTVASLGDLDNSRGPVGPLIIGPCTLRDAINSANTDTAVGNCGAGSGADTITFAVSGTITLTSPLPDLTSPITIDGDNKVTIDANGTGSVISVGTGGVAVLDSLTLTGGSAEFGGGMVNTGGSAEVLNSTITNNTAGLRGGGIENSGALVVVDSTITGNTAKCSGRGSTASRRSR